MKHHEMKHGHKRHHVKHEMKAGERSEAGYPVGHAHDQYMHGQSMSIPMHAHKDTELHHNMRHGHPAHSTHMAKHLMHPHSLSGCME